MLERFYSTRHRAKQAALLLTAAGYEEQTRIDVWRSGTVRVRCDVDDAAVRALLARGEDRDAGAGADDAGVVETYRGAGLRRFQSGANHHIGAAS